MAKQCHFPLVFHPQQLATTLLQNLPYVYARVMIAIHKFPTEMLLEVFGASDFHTIFAVSHVCRRWRHIAINKKELWASLPVSHRSARHKETLSVMFKRSAPKQMCLALNLSVPPADHQEFRDMLETVVKPHIGRCFYLHVTAQRGTWVAAILPGLAGADFRKLRGLDITNCTLPPAPAAILNPPAIINQLAHLPAVAHGAGIAPVVNAFLPPDLIFPFPLDDLLYVCRLSNMTLGCLGFPVMSLTLANEIPNIVAENGQMNRWMLFNAVDLTITHMQIPLVEYPDDDMDELDYLVPVQRLVLSQLRATPRATPDEDGLFEEDCTPFFSSLRTPWLCSLEIDRIDIAGRVWDDFLCAMPDDGEGYQCLEELTLREMHFTGISYGDLVLFFDAFPVLEVLELVACYEGMWQIVMEILELDPGLCPYLTEVCVDDGFVLRHDPLPFREDVFEDEEALEES
ncbi:hypothetical protein B0H10DRAFT_1263139 [Mycena sp. CBHHK59/15]|nr:hypothetical protein B0H10DRAFT_1263139 [Mycena sp. CBHHK59/15]